MAYLSNRGIQEALPAGVVFPYAGTAEPSGWLLCDGRAVSRTIYSRLFAAIGVSHGSGDGSTTFNIPDYRGRFIRGTDNMGTVLGSASRDPDGASRASMNAGGNSGNLVGSVQGSMFSSHNHGGGDHGHAGNFLQQGAGSGSLVGGGPDGAAGMAGSGTIISSQGGNENRPINANANCIIKT